MDREYLKDKKKIVIKIGSSSLIHEETGGLDYTKLEKLVRIICDLRIRTRMWSSYHREPSESEDRRWDLPEDLRRPRSDRRVLQWDRDS